MARTKSDLCGDITSRTLKVKTGSVRIDVSMMGTWGACWWSALLGEPAVPARMGRCLCDLAPRHVPEKKDLSFNSFSCRKARKWLA